MSIRSVLRMGDPRLWETSQEVEKFGTPELDALVMDMHDTMAALDGAGLAAPQIGVGLQVVIFGVKRNPRYPDVEEVPYTVLVNPVLTPQTEKMEQGWEGCLSVPGLRGMVPRYASVRYVGMFDHVVESVGGGKAEDQHRRLDVEIPAARNIGSVRSR